MDQPGLLFQHSLFWLIDSLHLAAELLWSQQSNPTSFECQADTAWDECVEHVMLALRTDEGIFWSPWTEFILIVCQGWISVIFSEFLGAPFPPSSSRVWKNGPKQDRTAFYIYVWNTPRNRKFYHLGPSTKQVPKKTHNNTPTYLAGCCASGQRPCC